MLSDWISFLAYPQFIWELGIKGFDVIVVVVGTWYDLELVVKIYK
jgi:hypothetical protein